MTKRCNFSLFIFIFAGIVEAACNDPPVVGAAWPEATVGAVHRSRTYREVLHPRSVDHRPYVAEGEGRIVRETRLTRYLKRILARYFKRSTNATGAVIYKIWLVRLIH